MNKINSIKVIILCILFSLCCSIAIAICLRKQAKGQYDYAVQLMQEHSIDSYKKAIEYFSELGDYKDSLIYIEEAQKYVDEYKEKEDKYNKAIEHYNNGEFLKALEIFRSLEDFQDSKEYTKIVLYDYASQLFQNAEYTEASQYFLELGEYKDSSTYAARSIVKITEVMQKKIYEEAKEYYLEGLYLDALERFEDISGYQDSIEWAEKCRIAYKRRQLATTIVAGTRQSTAIQSDGSVVSTVNNSEIQESIKQWENIVSVSAFGTLMIGLKEDGTVVTAGTYNGEMVPDVSKWENIIQVATGQQYAVGLKADGTVVGVGHKADKQLEFDNWSEIVYIAAGWRHTVGLDKDGNIHVAGYRASNFLKEIENNKEEWTNIKAIAAGGGYSKDSGNGHIVGLRSDGKVVAVGDNRFGQCNVKDWEGIVAIAAGDWHTLGLRDDGTVVAVGWLEDEEGKLTKGASSVEGWEKIVAISAGSGYSIGLKENGELESVGFDTEDACSKMDLWEKNILIFNEWDTVPDNKMLKK